MSKTKKLAISGIFIAIGVACSGFYIPIGVTKCFPIQHIINVILGVILGPYYAFGAAFATAIIRISMATGSALAIPGSVFGALLCGIMYKKYPKLSFAVIGEVIGTGIIGALVSYPVAVFLLGSDAAVFAYIIPFSISSIGGSIIAYTLLKMLEKSSVLKGLKND